MHLSNNPLLQSGKYQIVRFISSGGFGCTYEARHVMLDKRVAIKEFFVKDYCDRDDTSQSIRVGVSNNRPLVEKLRKRFVEEAQFVCRLSHPNIVQVTDVFEENGTAYLVMDYIEGHSLGELLKSGTLPEEKVVKYARQIAHALHYIHRFNRLHLDLKPDNIMIDLNDNALLIDFGSSKQYGTESEEELSSLVGKTPGYAPLEQMSNDLRKFLPATDIYSLGATLYKCLTASTPPPSNLLAAGERLAPLPPSVSTPLANAIRAAMQVGIADRPQNIEAFLDLLDPPQVDERLEVTILDGDSGGEVVPPSEPSPKGKGKVKSRILWVCLLAAVVLSSLLLVPFKQREPRTLSVTDQEFMFDTLRFRYTGPVNASGEPHGIGRGVYEDGIYEGDYVNGCREGKATYTTADRENTFKGTYQNDQYLEGTLVWHSDSTYYIGTFRNNGFDTGTFYNRDGTVDCECKAGRVGS